MSGKSGMIFRSVVEGLFKCDNIEVLYTDGNKIWERQFISWVLSLTTDIRWQLPEWNHYVILITTTTTIILVVV